MGQILLEDKIGALSHSSGVITLAASRLTIGGQQYQTSSLNRTIATDVTMTANTLYMIYAVLSGGVVSLRISTNVNSVGPAGFTAWKLVGAFYANGMSPVAFGSFVNIESSPKTSGISYIPLFSGAGTPTLVEYVWVRDGKYLSIIGKHTNGVLTATQAQILLPNVNIDTQEWSGSEYRHCGKYINNQSNSSASGSVLAYPASTTDRLLLGGRTIQSLENDAQPQLGTNSWIQNNPTYIQVQGVPISGWSNTPLKDL